MSAVTFLPSLTPQSTLAELPAWGVRLSATATGSVLDDVLRRDPELPGVVVFDGARVRGAISRSHFQQLISRPFGRDVVRPREIRHILDDLSKDEVLILDAHMPVQEAVRRALERDRTLIYEPVLVAANGSDDVRLIGFTDLLRADSRISSLRNQQMQEILATVQEGFLLVERDHRIASEYSRSVETILGQSGLAGLPLPGLLGSLLGPEQAVLAEAYLETLFNPNVIEKLVSDINPLKSVQVPERDGRPRRHLGFAFRRSTEGRAIRRILVRIEDRTREVELAAELEEQARQAGQRVDLAMEMMQVDPDALTDYLTRFLAEIAEIGRIRSRGDEHSVDAIFRILHSLKGEAGVIGFRTFAQRLHRAEDAVALLRDTSDLDPRRFERLDPWIDSLLSLGEDARELIVRLSALVHRNTMPDAAARRPADLVSDLDRLVADLSTRLGKPAHFLAHWDPAELPLPYNSAVRDVLIQLARNSMAHGVETEQERREANKRVPATIQFALRRHERERQLEIVFQDDGRGLDFARIRLRARALFGLDDLDDAQAAQIIFEPRFSTAETTTGDAGRGVGLDLVREKVESLGGMILVHSQPGVFCAFQIVLPLEPEVRA
jgi:HPt (histidine-containing phosphotransfer) domain-containing protein